ncbi:DUF2249 domain-containing protein (plasmid) [Halobaculum sp. CBA1158]|uniref:DUF2249 domain-containing protein n=1 Tax=Halobaculum sp. CBA1158 TaxID=2904243 RepID=UPI001F37885A|nr:DUF2249 domain-containing protein [Halobaculum sp. CBA1158]UIP01544.1 DUF2249 domain-containing protein [Halobaculum sp. CBA1158]
MDPTAVEGTDALDPDLRESLDAPADAPAEGIDVRDAPAPKPLTRTLETLESLPAETVLLQRNDRVPVHLFDRLDERGYRYETLERDGEALTAIRRE